MSQEQVQQEQANNYMLNPQGSGSLEYFEIAPSLLNDNSSSQELFDESDSRSQSASPPTEGGKGIKKSTAACEYCRKQHRKCNGASPCSNCIEKGVECIFTARKKRGPKNDATKKMKQELEELKIEVSKTKESEKNWKRKYMESVSGVNVKETSNDGVDIVQAPHDTKKRKVSYGSSSDEALSPPSVAVVQHSGGNESFNSNSLNQRFGSSQGVILCSMINDFIRIYETYIHPTHPLLPVSAQRFGEIIPELVVDMIREEDKDVVSNFYMFAMLSNSAIVSGNGELGKQFFERARNLAGKVFDVMESRVACGFIMLSYYSLCTGDFQKAGHYARIAKQISESLNSTSGDVYMNTLLAAGYASLDYTEKMRCFQLLGNGQTLGDLVFCMVGQVETELLFRNAPNWAVLIDMLMRAMRLQNEIGPNFYARSQDKFLHDVLVNGGLTQTLHRAKFTDLALEYAKKMIIYAQDPYFYYSCIGVTSNALMASANVFIDQRCTQELDMICTVFKNLSHRYKLCNFMLNSIADRIHKRDNGISYTDTLSGLTLDASTPSLLMPNVTISNTSKSSLNNIHNTITPTLPKQQETSPNNVSPFNSYTNPKPQPSAGVSQLSYSDYPFFPNAPQPRQQNEGDTNFWTNF